MANDFERVKQRLSVVDVLSRYINLKPNGQNYKAVCPFHNEKSASLIVSPAKEIWHCFGCGEGGDIFKFVTSFENVEKKDALRILAKQANIELTKLTPSKEGEVSTPKVDSTEFDIGQKYLKYITELYHQILLKTLQDKENPITKYCLGRGLSEEVIQKFQLGYSPKNDYILQFATKHKLSTDILTKVGLLRLSEFGKTKDKFSDRLMIPVLDKRGDSVGFTARTFPFDQIPNRPKYLNSSQSQWFNKSDLWYGWSINSPMIRQKNKVIIVEGNMDVIKAYQCSLDYVLASQGTSFTTLQLTNLRNLTRNVLLAFDNDQAGILAGYKFFREATVLGLEVSKLIIDSKYKDLDEKLSAGDTEISSINYLDFALNSNIHDLQSIDSKIQRLAILSFLDLLSVCDQITIEQYLAKLSSITKINTRTLSQFLKPKSKSSEQETQNTVFKQNDSTKTILDILKKLLSSVELTDPKIKICFELLKNLIPEIGEFGNIEEYVTGNKAELELIKENIISDEENTNQWYSLLVSHIDKNLNRILLQPSLKDMYLELKSM
jgi:DNA primase